MGYVPPSPPPKSRSSHCNYCGRQAGERASCDGCGAPVRYPKAAKYIDIDVSKMSTIEAKLLADSYTYFLDNKFSLTTVTPGMPYKI